MTTAVVVDGAGAPAVGALARLEQALHPTRVEATVAQLSDEALVQLYAQARALGRVAWVTMAIVAGHALERATAASLPMTTLAKAFGVHKSEISRAAKIYRLVIRPRMQRQGELATFPINGRSYYELAIEASEYSGQPAELLMARAEDQLAAGRYSLRQFRQELADEGLIASNLGLVEGIGGTLEARANTLRKLLSKLALLEDDAVDWAAREFLDDPAFGEWIEAAALLLARLEEQRAVEQSKRERTGRARNVNEGDDGDDDDFFEDEAAGAGR